jgi:hypothetical protein
MEEQLLQAKEELLQAKEELLQAKAHITSLRRARARERALGAKDIVHKRHKAEVPVPESSISAASASPPAPAPDCYCPLPHGSLGRYAAKNKHVVSALRSLPLPLPPSLTPASPSPFLPPLKCYKGFIYASAHVHDVDTFPPEDGPEPVDIGAGFEIAPGDAADLEVTKMHDWQCSHLVFSDGAMASTDMYSDDGYEGGIAFSFCN